MQKFNKKYINILVNNKYIKKHRKNNKMISIYMPNGVKAELDKFCKKKDLKISRWIVSMIMKEMEKILQKKYDIVLKKFVEIEGKCERKTKKLS